MSNITEVLSLAESTALAGYKQTITNGLKTFYDVGRALTEIRDNKLYRGTHKTFESFCQDEWDMERRHAYRLIAGAEVLENVSRGTQIPKVTERAVRPLTALPPARQRKAWAKLDKSKSITVTAVVQAVAKVQPLPSPPIPSAELSDSARQPFPPGAELAPPYVLADPLDDPLVAFKAKALVKWKRWFDGSTSPLSSMPCPTHKAYDEFVTALLK